MIIERRYITDITIGLRQDIWISRIKKNGDQELHDASIVKVYQDAMHSELNLKVDQQEL
ncbi:MAG: hypothetical protein P857_129 [Candidatus Xenolissoclinum pacificiensis L6]|uniref:Uncharacterized protein n=1 Tax=Candidatus Xenolissoclinum pacificiensis L6 TaxID=1401685 RepID=W2UYP0_9RICK|nr:MAG: hypothetical protein P857_129 [Candidatus Xenolissoclinum pacificiensis L6]